MTSDTFVRSVPEMPVASSELPTNYGYCLIKVAAHSACLFSIWFGVFNLQEYQQANFIMELQECLRCMRLNDVHLGEQSLVGEKNAIGVLLSVKEELPMSKDGDTLSENSYCTDTVIVVDSDISIDASVLSDVEVNISTDEADVQDDFSVSSTAALNGRIVILHTDIVPIFVNYPKPVSDLIKSINAGVYSSTTATLALARSRWIWELNKQDLCSVSSAAALEYIIKARLRDGFIVSDYQSSTSIISFVKEIPLQMTPKKDGCKNGGPSLSEDTAVIQECNIQYCTLQYVVFSIPGSTQIATELWVEPIFGWVASTLEPLSPSGAGAHSSTGWTWKNLFTQIFQKDLNFMSALFTVEYLVALSLRPTDDDAMTMVPNLKPLKSLPPANFEDPASYPSKFSPPRRIPFLFDISRVLNASHHLQLFFPLFQTEFSSESPEDNDRLTSQTWNSYLSTSIRSNNSSLFDGKVFSSKQHSRNASLDSFTTPDIMPHTPRLVPESAALDVVYLQSQSGKAALDGAASGFGSVPTLTPSMRRVSVAGMPPCLFSLDSIMYFLFLLKLDKDSDTEVPLSEEDFRQLEVILCAKGVGVHSHTTDAGYKTSGNISPLRNPSNLGGSMNTASFTPEPSARNCCWLHTRTFQCRCFLDTLSDDHMVLTFLPDPKCYCEEGWDNQSSGGSLWASKVFIPANEGKNELKSSMSGVGSLTSLGDIPFISGRSSFAAESKGSQVPNGEWVREEFGLYLSECSRTTLLKSITEPMNVQGESCDYSMLTPAKILQLAECVPGDSSSSFINQKALCLTHAFARNFVVAVYLRLQQQLPITNTDFVHAIDVCALAEREIDITSLLIKLTGHLRRLAPGPDTNALKADITDRFRKLIGGRFAHVPSNPDFFYLLVPEDVRTFLNQIGYTSRLGDEATENGVFIEPSSSFSPDPIFLGLDCSLRRNAKSGADLYVIKPVRELPLSVGDIVDTGVEECMDLEEALLQG